MIHKFMIPYIIVACCFSPAAKKQPATAEERNPCLKIHHTAKGFLLNSCMLLDARLLNSSSLSLIRFVCE